MTDIDAARLEYQARMLAEEHMRAADARHRRTAEELAALKRRHTALVSVARRTRDARRFHPADPFPLFEALDSLDEEVERLEGVPT